MDRILEVVKEVKSGRCENIEEVFDYFIRRIRIFQKVRTYLDYDDCVAIIRSEVWKSCVEFPLDDYFFGKVMIRIKRTLSNEIWRYRKKEIGLEDRFYLEMENSVQNGFEVDVAKEYYNYLVKTVYESLRKKNSLAAEVFKLKVAFPDTKKKVLAKMVGRTKGRISQVMKEFVEKEVMKVCLDF